MPVEYEAIRDSLIKQGKNEKTAKRIAAITYYKRHGVAVNKAHKSKKK